jgi:pseudouridylate synthase
MKELIIATNEAGKRLDKLLAGILPKADSGFLYKMLRKKNIVLNDKKATGRERLVQGDSVKIWFSDETFAKLSDGAQRRKHLSQYEEAFEKFQNTGIRILHETNDVCVFNKPPGILSQKAREEDLSLNEYWLGYLLHEQKTSEEALLSFRPSVMNRLDRGTSGCVLCAKTLMGANFLSQGLKDHTIHKYYHTIVKGILLGSGVITARLTKDKRRNLVQLQDLTHCKEDGKNPPIDSADLTQTVYRTMAVNREQGLSLVEVELKSGKTHQIRSHFASIGHPIAGDRKYGDFQWNQQLYKAFHLDSQLLHCRQVGWKSVKIDAPYFSKFQQIRDFYFCLRRETALHANMEFQRSSRFFPGRFNQPHQ